MGFAEKLNKRSEWYLKRHPLNMPYDFKEPILSPRSELKPPENRIGSFIKNIGQLVRKRVTSPKEK
jgi:hypothetical protein